MKQSTTTKQPTKAERFVEYVIKNISEDSAFRARLRRSSAKGMEMYALEYLNKWCNWTDDNQRLPYLLVGSSLSSTRKKSNGYLNFGRALSECYKDGSESKAAQARLMQILSCNSLTVLFPIMRQNLALIESREQPVNYAWLLGDLIAFGDRRKREKIKQKWAKSFYSYQGDEPVDTKSDINEKGE